MELLVELLVKLLLILLVERYTNANKDTTNNTK